MWLFQTNKEDCGIWNLVLTWAWMRRLDDWLRSWWRSWWWWWRWFHYFDFCWFLIDIIEISWLHWSIVWMRKSRRCGTIVIQSSWLLNVLIDDTSWWLCDSFRVAALEFCEWWSCFNAAGTALWFESSHNSLFFSFSLDSHFFQIWLLMISRNFSFFNVKVCSKMLLHTWGFFEVVHKAKNSRE